ncbi:MAG TPA: hypothetical protein VM260_06660 [Pirellula sp.]|nr:hypothetical protein [Pirellula sp.]
MAITKIRSISAEELDDAVALHQHDLLDRMVNAVLKVRERLERTSRCLAKGNVPYAIIGGNAVAAWVSTVDPGAVRNSRDVDILLRRDDFPRAIDAMATEGFVQEQAGSVTLFLDGPQGLPSQGVHVLWANEKVRPTYESATPSIESVRMLENMRIVELEDLVRMKLTSFRDKDKVHIRDFMSVGLVDASWLSRFTPLIADRLQTVLDNPDG